MKTFDDIYSEDDGFEHIELGGIEVAEGLAGANGKVTLYNDKGRLVTSGGGLDDAPEITRENAATAVLDADNGQLTLGGIGQEGNLVVTDKEGEEVFKVTGGNADMTLGGNGFNGDIYLNSSTDVQTIWLEAQSAKLELGAVGYNGDIHLKNNKAHETILLAADSATISLGGVRSSPSQPWSEPEGANGKVILYNDKGRSGSSSGSGDLVPIPMLENVATVVLDAENAQLTLGGFGQEGSLTLTNNAGEEVFKVTAGNADMTLGGNGFNGDIYMNSATDVRTIWLDTQNAKLTLGGVGYNGDISIRNNVDCEAILIDGASGDIHFRNCDVAEEFDVREDLVAEVSPGTVVVVDDDGKILPCSQEYDTRVVGIISGAGNYKPALILDRADRKGRVPVAIMGKVYCKAEADTASIRTGDLLTTSTISGHAAKVTDRGDAFGAVIGKALGPLQVGKGLIPVLVMGQ
jgi:hypothetical protein